MKKAVVVIPTYNEKGNISRTIQAVVKVFDKIKNWDMSILVIDDTSPDKTYEIVDKISKKNKKVHLLLNKKKKGLGAAYIKGLNHAFTKLKADVAFEFDADLSHDPSKIPALLEKIDEGYDLVLGSRYISGGGIPADWGLHRKFLSVVGNIFIKIFLTSFSISDWTTGYRAIKKEVFKKVSAEMKSEEFTGYTFQIGFLHKTLQNGFKVAEVPFHFKDRTVGKSKIGPEYIVNNLCYLTRVRIKDFVKSRVFKFLVVGTIGALSQLISIEYFRKFFYYPLAYFFAVEIAVIVNFILSNLWTFADRKLKTKQIPLKFLQFNLACSGSIIIQQVLAFIVTLIFSVEAPCIDACPELIGRGVIFPVLFIIPIIN